MLQENKVYGRKPKEGKPDTRYSIILGKEVSFSNYDMKDVDLTNNIYLDVNQSHMVLICGKRGYGKSYTLGVLAEGIGNLDEKIRENVCVILVDCMGIFWSLQEPNEDQKQLLKEWGLSPKALQNVVVYFPGGLKKFYQQALKKIYFHEPFGLYPSELNLGDWCYVMGISEETKQAALLREALDKVVETYGVYFSLRELKKIIIEEVPDKTGVAKDALLWKIDEARKWGIFSERHGKTIEDIIQPGKIVVLDLSGGGGVSINWRVRNVVVGILARKVFDKRLLEKLEEDISRVRGTRLKERKFPLVWLMIDEAQRFAPSGSTTPATEPLRDYVLRGRYPGVALVLSTQMPGNVDADILSQCDTQIVHLLSSQRDIDSIAQKISKVLVRGDREITLSDYLLNTMPREVGYAIVASDYNDRPAILKIRPRFSMHTGESAKISDFQERT